MAGLAGCQPQAPASTTVAPVEQQHATAQPVADKDPAEGKNRMTAMNGVLLVFAGETGTDWQAYDDVAGVQWRDAQAVEMPDVSDPELRFSRSGRLTLAGFGETDLPDGETGADAGLRRGNEGESGLTLNGNAQRVNEVVVLKFYPSEDYDTILRNQLPAAAKIVLEAVCPADDADSQKNRFYRIDLDGDTFAHVESYVDEESGPGSTTFVFTRDKQERRIAELACREAPQP